MLHPSQETYRSVTELKAVRRFTSEPVSNTHLDQILEAGRWTGSAKNLQLWAFIVIADPGLEKITQNIQRLRFESASRQEIYKALDNRRAGRMQVPVG